MKSTIKSVLIIEDDVFFVEKLKGFLQEFTEVITTDSAARGMYHLSMSKPDFVFLDNKLPRINGIEVITLFKEILPNTKIAIMSGAFTFQDIQLAIEQGVDYIIDKNELTKDKSINMLLGIDEVFTAKNVLKSKLVKSSLS